MSRSQPEKYLRNQAKVKKKNKKKISRFCNFKKS